MTLAGIAMIRHVESNVLPQLDACILDAAIDVRCIQDGVTCEFNVTTIELNPLGPGCVWGLVDWEHDSCWLLGREPPPGPNQTCDSHGGETCSIIIEQEGRNSVVRFTKESPRGLCMGGLAHMPPDYMMVVHERMGIEELLEKERLKRLAKRQE